MRAKSLHVRLPHASFERRGDKGTMDGVMATTARASDGRGTTVICIIISQLMAQEQGRKESFTFMLVVELGR